MYGRDARTFDSTIELSGLQRRDELWESSLTGDNSAIQNLAAQGAHHMFDFWKLRHKQRG